MITAVRTRLRRLPASARAVVYMMIMVVLFALLETTAKYLSRFYPVPMIVWSRYAVHLAMMVVLFAPRRGLRLIKTGQPGAQLVRASLLMGSTLFYFNSLRFMPLSSAKAISFVSPLLVTIFAAWLLSERVNMGRWLAVAAGFFGVLFIVRPGSGMLQWFAVLPLCSALCYSLYQIMTRKFSDREDPITTLFYSALVGSAILSAILPAFWKTPVWYHLPLLMFLGIAGGAGHFALIKAMELENASFLSPLGYAQLLWVILFGYLAFGDFPDTFGFIGIAIIVSAGLYVALGHRFKSREVPETALE